MKVKTISRSTTEHTRERASDLYTVKHNPSNDKLHPFQQAREYKRALNAVKLERLFSKPLVFGLDGHQEGVYAVQACPSDLKYAVSASADGDVRVWNLTKGECVGRQKHAHDSFIRSVSWHPSTYNLVTGSDDKQVKVWQFDLNAGFGVDSQESTEKQLKCLNTLQLDHPVLSVDHVKVSGRDVFATAGDRVSIFRYGKQDPVRVLTGTDTLDSLSRVRFNRADPELIASSSADRSVLLYDLRTDCHTPLSKTKLRMRANAMDWNPMEPYYLAVASEDHNAYMFDMRMAGKGAVALYRGAVGAVMDVCFNPTGQSLITAGYDRAVRIFDTKSTQCKDTFTTRRMQRVMSVSPTMDGKYILSGSDEGQVRVWRDTCVGSGPIAGPRNARERAAYEYAGALKSRFGDLPDIKRIANHRHLPKWMKREARQSREHDASIKRKQENQKRHGHDVSGDASVKKQIVVSSTD